MQEITACRVCYGNSLTPVFSLGEHYISAFPEGIAEKEQGDKWPLTLLLCAECGLLQLSCTAPQELLYSGHYWYRSGVTATMRAALQDVAHHVEAMVPLDADDVVLDIGSNDGTLLRSYTMPCRKVGVEPASNLRQEGAKGLELLIPGFWGHYETWYEYKIKIGRKAKVITALGMFYDLEDPNKFMQYVSLALDPKGIFVAQLMCLKNMLHCRDLGNICHEHLEFYSLRSLERMLDNHDLEIFDIETVPVNGESYRIFIQHRGAMEPTVKAKERVFKAKTLESRLAEKDFLVEQFGAFAEGKQKVVDFINKEVGKGKTVWVYGASTKGNTILQYYGLSCPTIQGAAERSPEKWGRFTVGTRIPIYSEQMARDSNPDYFLVLPYTFLSEFIEREEAWLRAGGKFIVPLPCPYLVSAKPDDPYLHKELL